MKIGLQSIGINNLARPDLLTSFVVHAERLDFATVWAGEHVVFLEKMGSKYPYFPECPVPSEQAMLNPLIALTYAAAKTTNIRIGTAICIVPEYNPLLLAKQVASLDYVSGGRFVLGMGIGWLKEEFEAMGIPWERRSARAREYVEAMRVLWSDQRNYSGEFVNFEGALSFPQPVKGGDFPILMGGNSEPALKRAASYASGWCGFNLSPSDTADATKLLRTLLKEAGRDPEDFEYIVAVTPASTPADLPAYRAAGIDQLDLYPILNYPLASDEEITSTLEEIAQDWVLPAAQL